MKQIVIFVILSIALLVLFVYCEEKSTNPPPPDNPGHYYPMQKDYSWRYVQLGGEGCGVIADSFHHIILGTNKRDNEVGWDLGWYHLSEISDTSFIYEKGDTLFLKKVGQSVPRLKILVGPIKAGTSWKDSSFFYIIEGLEDITLTINGETYKRCAKIVKTFRNPSPTKPDKVYEWWVPGYGEVKEMEVDKSDTCTLAKELRHFSKTGEFP